MTQVASHHNIFIYLIILMIIATKEKSGFRDSQRCHVIDAIYFVISPLLSDDVFVPLTIVMSGLMTARDIVTA